MTIFWRFYSFFFFFKQKTAYEMRISDWSSDVCSSDLIARVIFRLGAPDENNQIAQQQRCAERGDDQGNGHFAPTQQTEQQPVQQQGQPGRQYARQNDCRQESPAERQRTQSCATGEKTGEDQGEISAEGQEFAMRKVGKTQDVGCGGTENGRAACGERGVK